MHQALQNCAALPYALSPRSARWRAAAFTSSYREVAVDTSACQLERGIGVLPITELVRAELARSGVRNGLVTVTSKHTTTSVVVNEDETRLFSDLQRFLLRLAPPGAGYAHDDIALRHPPPGWTESVEEWRRKEPVNAQAHLAALLLGASESLPVVDGELTIGQWQSLLLVELDGPRARRVGVHVMGE